MMGGPQWVSTVPIGPIDADACGTALRRRAVAELPSDTLDELVADPRRPDAESIVRMLEDE